MRPLGAGSSGEAESRSLAETRARVGRIVGRATGPRNPRAGRRPRQQDRAPSFVAIARKCSTLTRYPSLSVLRGRLRHDLRGLGVVDPPSPLASGVDSEPAEAWGLRQRVVILHQGNLRWIPGRGAHDTGLPQGARTRARHDAPGRPRQYRRNDCARHTSHTQSQSHPALLVRHGKRRGRAAARTRTPRRTGRQRDAAPLDTPGSAVRAARPPLPAHAGAEGDPAAYDPGDIGAEQRASSSRTPRIETRAARLRRARRPRRQDSPEAGAEGAAPADGVRGHRRSAARAAREHRTGPRSQLTRPITPSYSEIP